MSAIAFRLAPYPELPFPAGVRLEGAARRDGARLGLSWRLEAPNARIDLPPANPHPQRIHGLWERTCFEFFLAVPEASGYWEFNLAPEGHWAVFRFDGYRAGMRDEMALDRLSFEVLAGSGRCEVVAELDLNALGIARQPWRLAIAAVLRQNDGPLSYWALRHPGLQPDFHHPDAFSLVLPSQA